jgi:hypothetical protein
MGLTVGGSSSQVSSPMKKPKAKRASSQESDVFDLVDETEEVASAGGTSQVLIFTLSPHFPPFLLFFLPGPLSLFLSSFFLPLLHKYIRHHMRKLCFFPFHISFFPLSNFPYISFFYLLCSFPVPSLLLSLSCFCLILLSFSFRLT